MSNRTLDALRAGALSLKEQTKDPELWCLCIIGVILWLAN